MIKVKINWQKVVNFIVGAVILSGSLGYLISFGINEFLKDIDRAVLERMLETPLKESLFTAFKLYIITYVLFGTLPDKFKNAKVLQRAIYFTLFYIFCTAIYIMI